MRWFLLLGCLLVNAACSWHNTVHAVGKTPQTLRFADAHAVVHAPRWRLAEASRVAVTGKGPAPQAWTDAAVSGVGRVFAPSAAQPAYVLEVHWPVPEGRKQAPAAQVAGGFRAGLFGVLEMPRLPPTGELTVFVRDADGRALHQLALRIAPKLWGRAWQEPAHIEAAFTHLAERLRDG